MQTGQNYTGNSGEFKYIRVALAKNIWEVAKFNDSKKLTLLYKAAADLLPRTFSYPIEKLLNGK